jgi:Mg/Co/Ni transporter MgtE
MHLVDTAIGEVVNKETIQYVAEFEKFTEFTDQEKQAIIKKIKDEADVDTMDDLDIDRQIKKVLYKPHHTVETFSTISPQDREALGKLVTNLSIAELTPVLEKFFNYP